LSFFFDTEDKRDAILELLVRAGAELNMIDSSGFTPLHNCAFQTVFNNFTLSTLKILVESGASMTQTER
jgi:ankyrin repeat protein